MSLPFYKSERNFRRYEPFIKQIIQNYPRETYLTPSNFSTETVTCRLRDAVNYYLKSSWESEIPKEVLRQVMDDFVVSHDGVRVRIGFPQKLASEQVQVKIESHDNIVIFNPTVAELRAFALLLSNQRLKLQVAFQIEDYILAEVKEELDENPLIQFFKDDLDQWVML